MTSVLNVDSIAAKDGTSAVTLTKQTAAKMWCNNDQNGQTINDSFNVSSISDPGAGKTDYAFANTMVNSSHAPQSSGFDNAVYVDFATSLVATTGFRSQTNNVDLEGLFVLTHGDLA